MIDEALHGALQLNINDFRRHRFFGSRDGLRHINAGIVRLIVVVFMMVLDNVAAYGINMDIVFFMTIAQVKIEYGTTVFHVEFKIVGTRAARFFGDSDGFGGANFALRQRLLLVALIGEGESTAGQGGQTKDSKEGFVHMNLSLLVNGRK